LFSSLGVPVLMFHKVPPGPDALVPSELTLAEFTSVIDFVDEHFEVLPLHDVVADMRRGKLRKGAACITFDDGYADWMGGAVPYLLKKKLHATFFLTTGQFDGTPMWHERVAHALRDFARPALDIPRLGMLQVPAATLEQRRRLRQQIEDLLKYMPVDEREDILAQLESDCGVRMADVARMPAADARQIHNLGFAIGTHTSRHPILNLCDDEEAYREIAEARESLAHLIGGPVASFAYPNGKPVKDFSARHIDMVRRAGYDFAVTTALGRAGAATPVFEIPRFTPWGPGKAAMTYQLSRNLAMRPRPIQRLGASRGGRALRVLCVENGAGFGGAVVALRSLAKNISRDNAQLHVVSNIKSADFAQLPAVAGHYVISDEVYNFRAVARKVQNSGLGRWRAPVLFLLGRLDDLCNRLPYILRLAWLALRVRPDVMHGNNEPSANREAMLVAMLFRIPYVQHLRGPLGRSRQARWLLGRPDIFIPVSRWLSGELIASGVPGAKICQIYDGVEFSGAGAAANAAKEQIARSAGIPRGSCVVAMVGMLVPWKGQLLFIDAVARIADRLPDVSFLVIGGTPERATPAYRDEIEARIRDRGLEGRVLLTGKMDNLSTLMGGLDVVVSASLQPEPLGLVMLEAMSAGRVFVGPAFGAATEVVEDGVNGFLFEPGSADSLAGKLIAAVATVKDARLSEQAAVRVRQKFLVANCVAATLDVYAIVEEA
jgi:glycosyltransferase involved in cell wall biosynthesis/peptidoglycan/xylan/chitin deacetylase (PgdA/CDA1 family)